MDFPKRKSPRLRKYDYSADGYYFVTICSKSKEKIFGNIVGRGLAPAENRLYLLGEIAEQELINLEKRYANIKIDKYVIMPNHIHAIIVIKNKTAGASPCPTLSDIICAFKSNTTRKYHLINSDKMVWQTSFHDHIIRGESDYLKIWNYIDTNPIKWKDDCFYFEDI